jgi:hypothetical protein
MVQANNDMVTGRKMAKGKTRNEVRKEVEWAMK